MKIDFTCPICKKEIQDEEADNVVLGDAENINICNPDNTDKVFIHISCLRDKKC